MINIICYGNSLTVGVGVAVQYKYPEQLGALLGAEYTVTRVGMDGQSTQNLITAYPSYISPMFNGSATRNILILWEIINHIALDGVTEAAALQALIDCTALATADGFEVVIGTGTMRSSMFMTGVNTTIDDMQNRILAVNADIRLGAVTGSIGYIDFARATYEGNSTLFETKFTTDPGPAPYTDSVHFSGVGYTSMANRAYGDILEILAGAQLLSCIKLPNGSSGGVIKTINGLSGGVVKTYNNSLWQ